MQRGELLPFGLLALGKLVEFAAGFGDGDLGFAQDLRGAALRGLLGGKVFFRGGDGIAHVA